MTDRNNGRRKIYRCECGFNKCTIRSFSDPSNFMTCTMGRPSWVRFNPRKGQMDMFDYFPEV